MYEHDVCVHTKVHITANGLVCRLFMLVGNRIESPFHLVNFLHVIFCFYTNQSHFILGIIIVLSGYIYIVYFSIALPVLLSSGICFYFRSLLYNFFHTGIEPRTSFMLEKHFSIEF